MEQKESRLVGIDYGYNMNNSQDRKSHYALSGVATEDATSRSSVLLLTTSQLSSLPSPPSLTSCIFSWSASPPDLCLDRRKGLDSFDVMGFRSEVTFSNGPSVECEGAGLTIDLAYSRSRYIASIALATPFSFTLSAWLLARDGCRRAHLSYHLTDDLCLCNLLLVGRRLEQCLCQVLSSQFSNGRSDPKRFHSLGPECLISKERLDNCWDTSFCHQPICRKSKESSNIPRNEAPDVPAPP